MQNALEMSSNCTFDLTRRLSRRKDDSVNNGASLEEEEVGWESRSRSRSRESTMERSVVIKYSSCSLSDEADPFAVRTRS